MLIWYRPFVNNLLDSDNLKNKISCWTINVELPWLFIKHLWGSRSNLCGVDYGKYYMVKAHLSHEVWNGWPSQGVLVIGASPKGDGWCYVIHFAIFSPDSSPLMQWVLSGLFKIIRSWSFWLVLMGHIGMHLWHSTQVVPKMIFHMLDYERSPKVVLVTF